MQQKYNCNVGLKSPAHITFVPPFWLEDDKEGLLLADVNSISKSCHSFHIKTKNFSAFRPRTIFIDVEKNEDLEKIKTTTDKFFEQATYCKFKNDTRPFHPHITTATRDLFKKSFYEAWPVFEKEIFLEEWEVNSLSVLQHNKQNWKVIHTCIFSLNSKDQIDDLLP